MTVHAATIDHDDVERFSRIAEEWWDEKGKFRPLHQINPVRIRYIRDAICGHFGLDSQHMRPFHTLNMMDIGCGGGLIAEPFARMGAKVTGIDASDKNIKVASLHADQMGLTIDYRCTSPEQLNQSPQDGEQYDVVCALEVVEHVSDVPLFLASCASLVKPGGIMFVSTLNRTIKSYAMAIIGAEYVLRWLPRGTHDWHKFIKPSELCQNLRNQAMAIQHMTGMVYNPLSRTWYMDERNMAVNYLITAVKT